MEWLREQVVTLIELFRERPVLWDQNLPEFKDKNKKNSALTEIGEELKVNKAEVQNKLRNLTSQFYRECKKAKSGSGADKKTKWFAFEQLQFLRDKTTPRHSRESGATKDLDELQQNDATEDSLIQKMDETVSDMTPLTTISNRPSSKRPRKRFYEPRAEEAYRVMKKLEEKAINKDEFDVFGEHVAFQLRKTKDLHDLAMAKRKINDILFDLEMSTITRNRQWIEPHSRDSSTPDSKSTAFSQTSSSEQPLATVNSDFPSNEEGLLIIGPYSEDSIPNDDFQNTESTL